MGSYSFFHGHQPEYPLKMGEVPRPCVMDVDIFIDRIADRIVCVWWRNRHQPIDIIR